MHSIAILIPHFGPWPPWIDFFVESCKANSDIDWILPSDGGPLPRNTAPNVKVIPFSFSEYCQLISDRLGIRFCPNNLYKLCDIKPALGEIHLDAVDAYDFFGFGDLDVIYGRIRDFYTDEILSTYSLLSTHTERISGHFALLRNFRTIRHAFRQIPSWKQLLKKDEYLSLDERPDKFLAALNGIRASVPGRIRNMKFLFQERYSTPWPTQDMRWYWRNGILTNEFYGARGFLYLHFMNWKSSRWYGKRLNVKQGARAPWESLQNTIQLEWRRASSEGFMISPSGIQEAAYRMYGGED
jgi:hypothetical protein